MGGRETQAYDERVLGGGEFVERLWREEDREGRPRPGRALGELMEEVARHFEVDPVRLQRRGKDARLVEARGVACYLAARVLGLASSEVGRLLGLGRSGVSRAAARGEQSVRREPSLIDLASGGRNQ